MHARESFQLLYSFLTSFQEKQCLAYILPVTLKVKCSVTCNAGVTRNNLCICIVVTYFALPPQTSKLQQRASLRVHECLPFFTMNLVVFALVLSLLINLCWVLVVFLFQPGTATGHKLTGVIALNSHFSFMFTAFFLHSSRPVPVCKFPRFFATRLSTQQKQLRQQHHQ